MLPLAIEIPAEALVTIGFVVTGLAVGASKYLLENRKAEKDTSQKAAGHRTLLDQKDHRIEELTTSLAAAKDEYAAKIQELSEVTIEKVEAMGSKNVDLLERVLSALNEFKDEVRKLRSILQDPPRRGGGS